MIVLTFGYIFFSTKVALHCLSNYTIISFITGTIFAYGVTSSGKTHTMHVRSINYAHAIFLCSISQPFLLSILLSMQFLVEALFHAWLQIM